MSLTKKAVIRDPKSAPIGQPGRLYINCCGHQLTVAEAYSRQRQEVVLCPSCETVYDSDGWIIEPLVKKGEL